MVQMRNRKMPTRGAARGFLALASILGLLYSLQPTALFLVALAVSLSAVGLLSIPRISYPRVLLYAFLSGLLPAVITYFIASSPAYCLAAFAFSPAAALLVLTIRRRNTRSAGIFWVTVSLTVVLAGTALLWLWLRAGSLSFGVFRQLYSEVKTAFIDYLTPLLAEGSDAFFLTGLEPEEAVRTLFDQLLTLLPGFLIMVLWIVAWLSTACLRWIFKGYVYGFDRFSVWQVTMWKPLGWVYIAAFVLSALPIDGIYSIVAIICNNLYLILLPGFVVVGCRVLKERVTRVPGCGCLPIVILIMTLFLIPGIAPVLLAFTGALRVIMPPKKPTVESSERNSDSETPPDQGGNSE